MVPVLVLRAAEDAAKADALVKSLHSAGVKAAAVNFVPATRDGPSCFVICHSAHSFSLVRDSEALLKRLEDSGRTVHVRLDKAAPADSAFVDLSAWQGGSRNSALAILRDKVHSVLRMRPRRRLAWLTGPRTMAALAYLGLAGALLPLTESLWRPLFSQVVWSPAERRYPIFEYGPPRPTREEAAGAVDRIARAQARRICADLAVGGEFRLVSAAAVEESRECASHSGAWRCGWKGTALCAVEIREVR